MIVVVSCLVTKLLGLQHQLLVDERRAQLVFHLVHKHEVFVEFLTTFVLGQCLGEWESGREGVGSRPLMAQSWPHPY